MQIFGTYIMILRNQVNINEKEMPLHPEGRVIHSGILVISILELVKHNRNTDCR